MTRRSLRPQLNQIRAWVRQGRTDAWIAHQLEVTVQQIQAFKREHGLEPGAEGNGTPLEEVDLRAEDDAAIASSSDARRSTSSAPAPSLPGSPSASSPCSRLKAWICWTVTSSW